MITKIGEALKKEDGWAAVIAAFAMVVILSMTAVVADVGMAYGQQSSLQTAVDSAALAGASALPDTFQAAERTKEYIIKNGYSPSDISIQFQSNNSVITVSAKKKVELDFARVFNIDDMDITARASASKEESGPFTYAIFSGSETAQLYLGGTFNIDGSVHANGSTRLDPRYGSIIGAAEACETLYINTWTTTVGKAVPDAPFVDMVDFTPYVNGVMPEYYSTILTSQQVNAITQKQYFNGNTKVTGSCTIRNQAVVDGNLYVEGDLVIKGGAPVCVLNGNIYATGNITFENTFKGSGCVFAKGSILFQGGQTDFSSTKTVCIYSETGNISFTAGSAQTTGIVYAPKGEINIQGGTLVFNGSIVANKITGVPSVLTIGKPGIALPFTLNESHVSLTQ